MTKYLIIILSVICLLSGLYLYHANHPKQSNPSNQLQLQKNNIQASQHHINIQRPIANNAISKAINQPKITQMVTAGTYITPDQITALETHDTNNITALTSAQSFINLQDNLINQQNTYIITQDQVIKHEKTKTKIILGASIITVILISL